MIGRLLGGVATSLLFSVFEVHQCQPFPVLCLVSVPLFPQSWMIASHFKQGFNGDQLGDTFTKAPLNLKDSIRSRTLSQPCVVLLPVGLLRQLDRGHLGRCRRRFRGR